MKKNSFIKAFGENIVPISRLSRDDFASALRKGLGRAWLHANQFGLEKIHDLVLDACLYDQSYDPQCEPQKADWLFSMIAETPYYAEFREIILKDLASVETGYDASQLSTLVKLMVLNGDDDARNYLQEFVFRMAGGTQKGDWIAGLDWIEINGLNGAVDLAKIYGQRLIRFPHDKPPDHLIQNNSELRELIHQNLDNEQTLKAYWEYTENKRKTKPTIHTVPSDEKWEIIKQNRRNKFRKKYPLNRVLSDAKEGKGEYYFISFGRFATKEELASVYAQLLKETKDFSRVRLLKVFRRAPLPNVDDQILDWAIGENKDLVKAAIAALTQISDLRLSELAERKCTNGDILGPSNNAFGLFLNNYMMSVPDLIVNALSRVTPTDDDAHKLVWDMIDLAKKYKDPELSEALQWGYENTPCANCRHNVLLQLDSIHALTEQIIYECQFDSDERIRDFAKEKAKMIKAELPNSNTQFGDDCKSTL